MAAAGLMAAGTLLPGRIQAAGLTWPANQLLPRFATPAPVLDCIDISSASSDEADFFASLEGVVNRTQPQVVCVTAGDGEGAYTWLNLHNLPYVVTNGYSALLKYRTNFTGLVVTDTNLADTLNLATTMAGVNNELVCGPSLLATLTNAPYNLPVVDDLRGRFADKYAVYGYLYTNYWPQCTHRLMAGLGTTIHGCLRDYLVAVKCATVWLDPGTAADATLLGKFMAGTTPVNGLYIGWWPSEANGLTWIASYGIPVLASDFFRNGSVFSGVPGAIHVPDIPPPPPLENKVYVALLLSDGDNVQYMQHAMKINWDNAARGQVPIGWTSTALAADLDPVMFNYYWSTATPNDCLISGPSGAGYTHLELWSTANLTAYTSLSDAYLQRAGLRIITVWDNVTTASARNFATNCPTLLGLTGQGTFSGVNLGLRTVALTPTYAGAIADMVSGITNAAAGWNGSGPLFIGAQATVWNLGPADMATIANTFDTNKFKFVRPDHLFLLANRIYGLPSAITLNALGISATNAMLGGSVIGNATNAMAWMEWGTNLAYGFRSVATNAGNGTVPVLVRASIAGLMPRQIYHYRVAVSNSLGVAWGADRRFTTGGRVKVLGFGALGETNVPASLTNVVAIACGASHGLAVSPDGTLAVWGDNTYGQTNVPPGLTNVVAVAGGARHSLALLANGSVAAWGDNTYGQTNVPPGLTNVIAIAAGSFHNLALKADQSLTAWGQNNFGQTNVPAGLTNVVGVAAGYGHTLALRADGTVLGWGYNGFGQTNVPAGSGAVTAVGAAQYNSALLKADATAPPALFPACRWAADSLSGIDGTAVSNWVDVVGGKSAGQAAAGSQPQLFSNVLNGHKVVRFVGTNSQYLTVAAGDNPLASATDFSLVVVFKTSTPGTASSSFYQNTGLVGAEQPGVVPDWALGLNGAQLGAGLGAGAGSCGSDFSLYGGNVTDGSLHIGIYVRASGTLRLYVDGVIVAEQTSLCPAARGNYPFQIGAMTASSGFLTGDIAEIQFFKRALSAQDIAGADSALAAAYGLSNFAGAPVNRWVADNLAGANNSTVATWPDVLGGKNAAQAVSARQPRLYTSGLNGHKSVHFTGSQYLTVSAADSALSSAGSYTVVVVLKTSTAGSASSLFYQNTGVLGAEQPGVVADWALCLNGAQWGAGLGSGAGGCSSDFSLYGGNVTDGNPHIAVCVRAGSMINLYVDGVLVATQGGLCPQARGNYPFLIGAMTTSTYFFTGDIAEIQLFNRALDAGEVMGVNETLAATYGVAGAAGAVAIWGNNSYGQNSPPQGLGSAAALALGNYFDLALKSDGRVAGWGNGGQGQTNVPPGLTNVAALAAGSTFGLAIGDQPPAVSNATFAGFVNHDLTLALPGTSFDGLRLNFHLLSLPAGGALYQSVVGARGLPITNPGTVVSDPGGQIIFAPATNGTGSPYATFNFSGDDGEYASGSAQATLNIGLPAVPRFSGGAGYFTNLADGSFELGFAGSVHATYSVWAATNLVDWVNVGTAAETLPGVYQFPDAAATKWPQRFYRVSAP